MQQARYGDPVEAARNPEQLTELLTQIIDVQQSQAAQSGLSSQSPSTPLTFTVQGVDGHYKITIYPQGFDPYSTLAQQQVNAANALAISAAQLLTHQLRSSTTKDFDAAGSVATYGPDPKLQWDIIDPNVRKFWQLRTSNDNGVTWNDWQDFKDVNVCGIVAVWSGLLRTSSLSPVNAQNGFTTAGILTQPSTAVSTVVVAGSVANFGFGQISYQGGSATGGFYGATWIYADDPEYKGGAVIYHATANQSDLSAVEGRINFGMITTVSGGAPPTPGGGGGCVEKGVPVFFPLGVEMDVIEMEEPNEHWALLTLMGEDEVVPVHPDTLVAVFKAARELKRGDRIEGPEGGWCLLEAMMLQTRKGTKVRRTVPGRIYRAGSRAQYRLHNSKPSPE